MEDKGVYKDNIQNEASLRNKPVVHYQGTACYSTVQGQGRRDAPCRLALTVYCKGLGFNRA